MRLILSVVGTSMLTNGAKYPEIGQLLRDTANKNEVDLSPEEKIGIDARISQLNDMLKTGSADVWQRQSAEINGILSYDRVDKSDMHILLATDTYQGRITADFVERFLRNQGCDQVSVYIPAGLSVKNADSFRKGMVNVVKYCEETLNDYRERSYEIIFNLTGGFKSVIGYVNTLGMIYADKLIYVFESKAELVSIPRLPLRMDDSLADRHAVAFAILDQCGMAKSESISISEIPELYLDKVAMDGTEYVSLSAWGTLVWLRCKASVLGGTELRSWPLVRAGNSFIRDYKNITDERFRTAVQESLAKAAGLLLENNLDLAVLKRDSGLLYEEYAGKNKGIGHYHVGQGPRVSCKMEDGYLNLRHVGKHDYVNDNP